MRPLNLCLSGFPPFHADISAPTMLFHVTLVCGMWPAAPMHTMWQLPVDCTSILVTDAWRRWNKRQACAALSIGTPAALISKYRIMLLWATTNKVSASPCCGATNNLRKTSSALSGFE
eukprot:CAMPEP_0115372172 /NCGR_PEP_ID=MMETSP0271-20121206/764_1 /TAXON_ID=71861 /ORGANISM="Scrippsiella trochoidea, Strain CCMP3099" /LENGTH=117 /DNA_ID=CAMNT_0002795105 /DNA_START=126 /DNA_END=476 /DNA_ORIENTATION=-